jgi:hypothetical protein
MGYSRRPSEKQRRSYNRFESLSTEVECYKCNNLGHMAKNCRMTVPPKEPQHVGAAFVFSSPSQISCLNARNRKVVFVFSVCGFKISEDLSRKQR